MQQSISKPSGKQTSFLWGVLLCCACCFFLFSLNAAVAAGIPIIGYVDVEVSKGAANLRDQPSENGELVIALSNGTPLTVVGEHNGENGRLWYEVYTRAGEHGWISSRLVSSLRYAKAGSIYALPGASASSAARTSAHSTPSPRISAAPSPSEKSAAAHTARSRETAASRPRITTLPTAAARATVSRRFHARPFIAIAVFVFLLILSYHQRHTQNSSEAEKNTVAEQPTPAAKPPVTPAPPSQTLKEEPMVALNAQYAELHTRARFSQSIFLGFANGYTLDIGEEVNRFIADHPKDFDDAIKQNRRLQSMYDAYRKKADALVKTCNSQNAQLLPPPITSFEFVFLYTDRRTNLPAKCKASFSLENITARYEEVKRGKPALDPKDNVSSQHLYSVAETLSGNCPLCNGKLIARKMNIPVFDERDIFYRYFYGTVQRCAACGTVFIPDCEVKRIVSIVRSARPNFKPRIKTKDSIRTAQNNTQHTTRSRDYVNAPVSPTYINTKIQREEGVPSNAENYKSLNPESFLKKMGYSTSVGEPERRKILDEALKLYSTRRITDLLCTFINIHKNQKKNYSRAISVWQSDCEYINRKSRWR